MVIQMKKIIFILSFLYATNGFAQFSFLRKVPVKPVMDIGFSTYGNAPTNMEINLIGSRTVNIAALYEVYISDHFTFNTGIGVSMERYSFEKNVTLRETFDGQNNKIVGVFPLAYADVRKSLLAPTYLDIPVEFRAVTSTGRQTFRFILGFKAGVLVAAHTKVKYGTGDDLRTEKFKDDFLLNRFRYGIYGRVGYKSMHLYTYYSLSDLFQANKLLPNQAVMPLTFGLSFMMF
ncbi:MAG: PorT family protein [Cytophagales bacterium]|nr:MAG: PorT family protein [Cytophagales bacterium]